MCVHVPLLLGSDTGRTETLLIAVLLALVAMLFEAIAWAGLDNLVLPLVGHLLLRIYLGLTVADLEMRLAVTAGADDFRLLLPDADDPAGERLARGLSGRLH